MPAVVRIKRRIDEEPHSAFLLNGKRRRLLNDEDAPATSTAPIADNKEEQNQVLLKFAGTLEKQVSGWAEHLHSRRVSKLRHGLLKSRCFRTTAPPNNLLQLV